MNRQTGFFADSVALLSSIARRLGYFLRKLHPHTSDFESLTVCPSCGLITSKYKNSCLECGKALKAA